MNKFEVTVKDFAMAVMNKFQLTAKDFAMTVWRGLRYLLLFLLVVAVLALSMGVLLGGTFLCAWLLLQAGDKSITARYIITAISLVFILYWIGSMVRE